MARAETPLVFLPGALDTIEGLDRVTECLAADRPVIRIAYDADDTLPRLLDRILEQASEVGAGRFDLLGQSYGGWIAQCIAQLHPARVRRMVLSHSFVLHPGDGWRLALGSTFLRRMPVRLLRPLLLKRVGSVLAPLREMDASLAERQLTALADAIGRADFRAKLVAQQRCMRQSLSLPAVTAAPDPAGPSVLIIESENDPLIRARQRLALNARYSRAETFRFSKAGHISALVETDAYLRAVKAFLDG